MIPWYGYSEQTCCWLTLTLCPQLVDTPPNRSFHNKGLKWASNQMDISPSTKSDFFSRNSHPLNFWSQLDPGTSASFLLQASTGPFTSSFHSHVSTYESPCVKRLHASAGPNQARTQRSPARVPRSHQLGWEWNLTNFYELLNCQSWGVRFQTILLALDYFDDQLQHSTSSKGQRPKSTFVQIPDSDIRWKRHRDTTAKTRPSSLQPSPGMPDLLWTFAVQILITMTVKNSKYVTQKPSEQQIWNSNKITNHHWNQTALTVFMRIW